jgi:hypothetical protein
VSATTTERHETGWLDDTPAEDNVIRQIVRNQGDLSIEQARASGGRAAEARGPSPSRATTAVPAS